MRAHNFVLILAAGLLLSACNKVQFSKDEGALCQGFNQDCITSNGVDRFDYQVTVNQGTNKVDILFVDDNSGSMQPEQQQLGSRFGAFINTLSGIDWRVGITTTDMSEINTSNATKGGKLLSFANGGINSFFLAPSMGSYNNLQNAFVNTIVRPEVGWGDERGIYAAKKLLERSRNGGTNENGFIRDNPADEFSPHLAVVILADEDERSDGGVAQIPTYNPATGTGMNPYITPSMESGNDYPQDLINYVTSAWGHRKSLTVHSIIVKPGDSSCLNTQRSQPGGTAHYGNNYAQLTAMTGGVLGSVCDYDYTGQLQAIGQVTQNTLSSVTIACTPIAGTLQVIGVAPGQWTSSGNKVFFNPVLTPGTTVRLIYDCVAR